MNNYYKKDDVYLNSWFGFDYAFCHSDCINKKCGRNHESESYKTMARFEPVHSESDFSSKCKNYRKPKGDKYDKRRLNEENDGRGVVKNNSESNI